MNFLAIAFLFVHGFTANAFAAIETANTAQVILLRGDVKNAGQALKEGDTVKLPALLKSGDKSYAKIVLDQDKSTIVLAPNSEMQVLAANASAASARVELQDGALRWISGAKANHNGVQVRTKAAAFAVRGTNFLIKHRAAPQESEIIVFDGNVLFQNAKYKTDSIVVNKSQWGGLGGKFGDKIGPLKTLDEKTLAGISAEFDPK